MRWGNEVGGWNGEMTARAMRVVSMGWRVVATVRYFVWGAHEVQSGSKGEEGGREERRGEKREILENFEG
jgi:hypothetical protein